MGYWRSEAGNLLVSTVRRASRSQLVRKRLYDELVAMSAAAPRSATSQHPSVDSLSFLALCAAMRPLSRAQRFQDLWVLFECGFARGGFFVEFGAADGLAHSNSASLEFEFDWKGILAEPNPHVVEAARRNRPNSVVDDRCVWRETGTTLEFLVAQDPELSTIADKADSDMHASDRRRASELLRVGTITLSDLLDELDAPKQINYLSVDTEGSELDILEEFDFSSRVIDLVSVEHNFRRETDQLDALMRANGYERRFPEYSAFDAWYRRRRPN